MKEGGKPLKAFMSMKIINFKMYYSPSITKRYFLKYIIQLW